MYPLLFFMVGNLLYFVDECEFCCICNVLAAASVINLLIVLKVWLFYSHLVLFLFSTLCLSVCLAVGLYVLLTAQNGPRETAIEYFSRWLMFQQPSWADSIRLCPCQPASLPAWLNSACIFPNVSYHTDMNSETFFILWTERVFLFDIKAFEDNALNWFSLESFRLARGMVCIWALNEWKITHTLNSNLKFFAFFWSNRIQCL